MPNDYFRNEWEKHTEACRKTQDKTKLMEQMTARYAHLLSEDKPLKEISKDPKTSSEVSFISSASASTNSESERPCKSNYNPSDLTKEIINNVPVFDGKTSELNQFINMIKSVASLYNIPKIQIVLLRTRGKSHKIIMHVIEDDLEAGWEGVKRKLTSSYSITKNRIDAGIQLKNSFKKENKTVSKYLAKARTLFKAKLRYAT